MSTDQPFALASTTRDRQYAVMWLWRRLFPPASAALVRKRYQRAGFACPIVSVEDFVSMDDARRALKFRSKLGVRHLISRRVLEPCFLDDPTSPWSAGVTGDSVAAEIEWWATASLPRRVIRRITGPLNYVS